jgi:predicted HTH domain antitoxin
MTRTIISPADLSQRTREILDRVQGGELAVVASAGEERIVLLDAVDYRLLLALAACVASEGANGSEDLVDAQVMHDYLEGRINLGKAAELLHLTRFELEESLQRLQIPLRRGARSIEDAQSEIAAARRHA